METVETYRKLVQHMLQAHANEEGGRGVEVQLVFDTVHDHYQLWYIGWQGEHRIRGCVLQVDIKDGKIWIQYDGPKRVSRAPWCKPGSRRRTSCWLSTRP